MRLLELLRPFRVVVTRRVAEEEQASVECFARTQAEASERLAETLRIFRDHRKRTNEEVVAATRQQLTGLETAIQLRGEELHKLDAVLDEKRATVTKLDEQLTAKKKRLGISSVG